MLSKSLLVLSAAVFVLADPIPAPIPQTSFDLASFPTDPAGISSQLASVSSLVAVLSGMPTIPGSVVSVLATAVPASELTRTDIACIATSTPGWYKSLPGDVKSALSSYETAFGSWYSVHSSELGLSGATSLPAPCSAGTTAAAQTKTGTSAGATKTESSSGSTSTSGSASKASSSSASGSAAGASSSTASGTATGATQTPGAATPRATGAMAASFAGLVGALGVMAIL